MKKEKEYTLIYLDREGNELTEKRKQLPLKKKLRNKEKRLLPYV